MKKLLAAAAAVASAIMIIVFMGGCVGQKIAEKVTEEAIERAIEKESGEGEVNIDTDEQSMQIQSDEGEAEFGTGAELPEDFPGNVPLYSGMQITTSWKISEGEETSYSITAVSEMGVDEIFGWYKDNLGGWEISGEYSLDTEEGRTSSLNASKGEVEITLMIMENEEGTTIVQSVTE
jgi:hypothetical protein